jgi:hypothetical protein
MYILYVSKNIPNSKGIREEGLSAGMNKHSCSPFFSSSAVDGGGGRRGLIHLTRG